VEAVGAVSSAAIALRFGASFLTLGVTAVALIGVALAAIDLRSYRLPDKLIGIAMAMLSVTLVAEALTSGQWSRLLGSSLGALGLGACYLVLAVIQPGQLGLGDVKLAVLLGMLLGWFGWPFVLLGGCLAFLLSAATILVLLALRKISMRSHIPFGPFMLLGTAATLLL
jgi:leader peptidase (prepilin peptidase)/N-methyltransferase